jgi:hypothetical protein
MLSEGLRVPEMGAKIHGRKEFHRRELVAPIRSAVLEAGEWEQQAAHLRDSAASIFMFASMGNVLAGLDVAAYRLYRDRLLADYGDPADPVVVMLLEQLALVHLNIGQLFGKAASANSLECAGAYLAATTSLMGEFRRTALAVPAYREAVQRLERGPDPAEPCHEKNSSDSELHDREDSDESTTAIRPIGATWRTRAINRKSREASLETLASRPWVHSTGPRTDGGKLRSAQNGRATQKGELWVRQLRAELAPLMALARQMATTRDEIDGLVQRSKGPGKG